jgi:hypothetical protein
MRRALTALPSLLSGVMRLPLAEVSLEAAVPLLCCLIALPIPIIAPVLML